MKKVSRQPVLLGMALMFCGVGVLYGCKEFLTDASAPQGTLDQNVLATAAGVEGNLIAAYRSLDYTTGVGGTQGSAASNWIWGSVVSDDAYKGSEASDASGVTEIEQYHWNTPGAQGWLNDKWRGVYEGVVRANATMRLLKQVQLGAPPAFETVAANGVRGEALFLRAYYHFEAWKLWGNVPYIREDDLDPRKPALTKDAVAVEIMKDLDEAITLLPLTPRNGQTGRASRWTAKAYKGRLQMYTNQYAAALTTLREIQSAGPYDLEPSYDRVWSGFQANANGKETVFAFQASSNDKETNGNNANYGERLNFPHSGSPFGCCGFHQASQNLINFFKTDATTGLPTMISQPTSWNASDANLDAAAGATTSVDPRIDYTAGRDNVPFKDWGVHKPNWIRDIPNGGFYSPKKNIHEKASGAQSSVGWVNTQLNSVNIHLLRYADVLLLLAEAEVEAGVVENARTIVNRIRTRAGVTAQGCGYPADAALAALEAAAQPQCVGDARIAVPIADASITWARYRVGLYPVFASQAAAREAVRNERRLELAMEGQRFFDLRRWGTYATTLNAYINDVGGGNEKRRRLYMGSAEPLAARHALYPIPPTQIQLSTVGTVSALTQNPGW